ncbi:MAG TPA: hypothetical protein VIM25_03390, partial [Candidatus Limnocylindrales bacterium]
MRRREGRHLVVDQPGGLRRFDDVDAAQGRGLALARDDPDGAIRSDTRGEVPKPRKILERIGADEDDVRVGLG